MGLYVYSLQLLTNAFSALARCTDSFILSFDLRHTQVTNQMPQLKGGYCGARESGGVCIYREVPIARLPECRCDAAKLQESPTHGCRLAKSWKALKEALESTFHQEVNK